MSEEVHKELVKEELTVGFTWLLCPEPEKEELLLPSMEDILLSKELKCDDKLMILEHCSLTDDQIVYVSKITAGQTTNWQWGKFRQFRLTSSNFAPILKSCARNTYPPSLFKRITGHYNLDAVKSIQWGKQHEKTAAQAFENASGLKMTETGIWLDSFGMLEASPDGLVQLEDGSTATVEIKCPFKFRNECLEEALKTTKTYVVKYNSGKAELNKKHDYYDQIQGQMHLVNCTKCFLVIWTLKSCLVLRIDKDDTWNANIDTLKTFYVEQYLPHLLSNVNSILS